MYGVYIRLANLGAKTVGENQTPMHYASKNNAAASLKIMLRLGAHINDRDYKRRTPLFVAAETGIFLWPISREKWLWIAFFGWAAGPYVEIHVTGNYMT